MFFAILIGACSGGGDDVETPVENPDIIPENLVLNIEVVGKDNNNHNGDGSGKIICTATSSNTVNYKFKFGGNSNEISSTSGVLEHTFRAEGTQTYLVTVFAYSRTGNSVSTFKNISVNVAVSGPQLIWSDEFDASGAPDATKWGYDIGNGCPNICGWGNGEKEYYTSRFDNVKVENGILKIIAKKENYQGYGYTSAKLLTKGKFDFTYGRVDVKAKLPSGTGTWPAIWMLGANIDTVGWPACGEIDIMEHWGHNPNKVSSATHTTSCSGGCSDTQVGETIISDYAAAFHVYSVEWAENELKFLIDNVYKYSYKPSVMNNSTWPYNAPQYLILNVAMGGNWFTIDPNFTESIMEIDYVRVYQ